MSRRILIIQDRDGLPRSWRDQLAFEGYDVRHVRDGTSGLAAWLDWRPNLVVLDLTSPGSTGTRISQAVPVIVLHGPLDDPKQIREWEPAGDHSTSTPFSIDQLVTRIRLELHRGDGDQPAAGQVRFAGVVVDLDRSRVDRDGFRIPFTQKEMELLRFLVIHPGRAFSRDELLHIVWGYRQAPLTRTVDTHVARLRHKLEDDPHNPRYIQTVYGTGYAFIP